MDAVTTAVDRLVGELAHGLEFATERSNRND